jgi:hypothetical protein
MSRPRVPAPLAALKREIEMWLGLLLFGVGIAMLIIAANLALTELRYAREAILVPATVLERDFIAADRSENPRTRYRVRYRYAVAGGQPQELLEEVDVDRWEARAPGMQFDVAVLAQEDARAGDGGLAEMVSAAGLVFLGAIFVSVGWSLGVSRLRRALGQARVYRRGAEARGEVLEVADTGTAINRVPMSRMRFRFTDVHGEVHEGETGLLSPEEAGGLEPGTTGLVRYDEGDPGINVWVDA